MDKTELIRLARLGAEARLQVLQSEIAQIRRQFPDLGSTVKGSAATPIKSSAPRRRRMSAAQRKAVSQRMKRYWAAKRKDR